MKRHAPEDVDTDDCPLFERRVAVAEPVQHLATRDLPTAIEALRAREDGMANALCSAEARGGSWPANFVEAVRLVAMSREFFLAEAVLARCPEPSDVTPRATGPLMQRAARLGYCVAAGAAPAKTSNGSFKVRWRSLVWRGGSRA